MGLFGKLRGRGRKAPAPTLTRVLDGYPPYEEPYPGLTQTLTLDQARANLAYLLDTKDARQAMLCERLKDEGLDFAAALDPDADPLPAFGLVGEWFSTGAAYDFPPACKDVETYAHRITRRDGNLIVLSLAKDVSILISESIIAREPKAYWGLWLDSEERVMEHYKRCVVLGLSKINIAPPLLCRSKQRTSSSAVE